MSTVATAASALRPAADWPLLIVLVALGSTALLFAALASAVAKRAEVKWLTSPAPSPKLSFESWATHLTAVGAVLGTALGTASLPESPTQIDRESLVALSLLFGGLVVVAPFIFEAVRRRPVTPAPAEGAGESSGFVGVLLLACAITFGAVFGELFTLGLAAWELTGGDLGGVLIEVGLGALSALALNYVAITAWEAAMADWKPQAQQQTSTPGAGAPETATAVAERAVLEGTQEVVSRKAVPTRRYWSLP